MADPGTVAGRINIYSLEQQLAGNSGPVLVPDMFTVDAANVPVISVRQLTANDIDAEGDELFLMNVSLIGSSNGGLQQVNVEGVQDLQYIPQPAAVSGDSETFGLQISDRVCPVPNGATTTLTFTIQ